MQTDTAPNITVRRTRYRAASGPITRPPNELPNQASELARDGPERLPPKSAAIALRPTATIQSAPNATASITSDRLATTQEVRVSMVGIDNVRSRQVTAAKRRGRTALPGGGGQVHC